MSHSFPTAPPLPPTPPLPHNGKSITDSSTASPIKNQIDECLWSLEWPELQKACFLARICANNPPIKCQYSSVPSILQEGPTCGLAALSMLLGGNPTAQQLLNNAKELKYTRNGEMFSARDLYKMICDHTSIEANNNVDCQLLEGRLNCAKVRKCLLDGMCMFAPYDPDFNHAPCLKLGHKAHWALIVGYLISDTDEFYVLARHGKAKNLAVWSLEALSESNANLIEFAQPKGYPNCDFLLPPGGIGGDLGLRERAIVLKIITHDIIKIK